MGALIAAISCFRSEIIRLISLNSTVLVLFGVFPSTGMVMMVEDICCCCWSLSAGLVAVLVNFFTSSSLTGMVEEGTGTGCWSEVEEGKGCCLEEGAGASYWSEVVEGKG